ncbi:MAG: nucleoside hydrolase [Alphaproteobacteria bacterium]
MAQPLIIDCDPGQDDAVALLLAMASPEMFDLLGICAVAGNVPISRTAYNARVIRELAGRLEVPVFAGCPRPMLLPPTTAEHIHGKLGIDGAELPEPTAPLDPAHAVVWLIETLRGAERPVTLATLGPLTNLAAALVMAPDIASKLDRLVLMGGAIGYGNITASAEFNILVDPHAASVVFGAGLSLTMIGLDVTHQAKATPERIERIAASGTGAARAVAGMLRFFSARYAAVGRSAEGAPLHDPCVIAYLMRPEIFEGRPMRVDIETASGLTLGRTVCDPHCRDGRAANATVLERIDAEAYFGLIAERMARLP